MRLRRTFLYTPGDDLHKIGKASLSKADCVCLDLEDSIADKQKKKARVNVKDALVTIDFGHAERLVRVNGQWTSYFMEDIHIIIESQPDGVVVPKVEDAQVLQFLDSILDAYEIRNNLKKETIKLIAIIESAKSFLNLKEICTSTTRLDALVFGAEDFAVDLGAIRTESNREVYHARSEMMLYAAAYKLNAIDMVCNDYKHLEILETEAQDGAELGYTGKQVIHPDQIEIVNQAFSPKMEDIMKAKKIVTDYESQLVVGKGAIGLDGRLVDRPVYKQSKSLLEKVALIEKFNK